MEALFAFAPGTEHIVGAITPLTEVNHDMGDLVPGIIRAAPEDEIARFDPFSSAHLIGDRLRVDHRPVFAQPAVLVETRPGNVFEPDVRKHILHRARAIHAAFAGMVATKHVGETEFGNLLGPGADHSEQLQHFLRGFAAAEKRPFRAAFAPLIAVAFEGECIGRWRIDRLLIDNCLGQGLCRRLGIRILNRELSDLLQWRRTRLGSWWTLLLEKTRLRWFEYKQGKKESGW